MSNNVNSIWFDRAAEMISYWEGKLPAQLIQQDLDNDDLENMQYHILQAEAEASRLEFAQEPNSFMSGDELAEVRSSDDY